MTDVVSEFVRRRQPESLDEIEDTIAQHRKATEQSTYQADMRPGGMLEVRAPAPRDALTDLALIMAALPLRIAMEMADAVVTLPEFKAPANKIELAMLLNEWAEKRLAGVYGAREG
jgi:hypothetical protein